MMEIIEVLKQVLHKLNVNLGVMLIVKSKDCRSSENSPSGNSCTIVSSPSPVESFPTKSLE